MSRKIRISLGVLVFIFSVALLIWGFIPLQHETRRQDISPSEMQLPTPASFLLNYEVAL